MDGGFFVEAVELPSGSVGEVVIVAFGFSVDLVFSAEVSAARFFAVEGVTGHELTKFDKVDDTARFFEFLVDIACITGDADIVPEVFAKILDLFDGFLESLFGAADADFVEEDFTEATMETFGGLVSFGFEEAIDEVAGVVDGLFASVVGSGEG